MGSAFESTVAASITSPDSSSTPVAAPPSASTRATGASVRISAPASRAASAIIRVTSPMPPGTKPQRRMPPPASSAAWSCSSTYAVPGVPGPATLSLIACQPSDAFR